MNEKLLIFLIFIMAFIGVGAYWYVLEYTPLIEQQASLNKEIDSIKLEMKKNKKLDEELKEKQRMLAETQSEYQNVLKSVITRKDMSIPDLIRVVRNYAKQAKVEFAEIKVNKMYNYESYDEIPIDFHFTGPYHNIGRMMARLENLKLINARKGKFSLAPYKKTGSTDSFRSRRDFAVSQAEEENEIAMDLSASSFIFKDKGGDLGAQNF